MELTMLKAVVQDMDTKILTSWRIVRPWVVLAGVTFCDQTRVVALRRNVNRNARGVRNQQRFVAEQLRFALSVNSCRNGRAATIATREHIDVISSLREEPCQSDHQRRLPCSARGKIANRNHLPFQALNGSAARLES